MKSFVTGRLVSAVVLISAGCGGPIVGIPGGQLSGVEAPLEEANIPAEGSVIQLETRPTDPYSVNLGSVVIDGRVYIDPAAERQWYQHIQEDNNVRVRFEGSKVVHPAVAVTEKDPAILAQFDAERIVLRLDSR